MTLRVTLPDGSPLELADGATVADAAAAIGPRLAKAAIAGRVTAADSPDGTRLVDTSAALHEGDTVAIVTAADPDGLDVLRHTASHVMAQAVLRLLPGTEYAIGPTIENGFYYDFRFAEPIAEADLARIEKEMAKVVSQNLATTRYELPVDEALAVFGGRRGRHLRVRPAARPGPAVQGRAHRGPGLRAREAEGRDGAHHQRLHPGRVHRPLPRPASAEHRPSSAPAPSSSPALPAPTGAATRRTRC